MGKGERGGQINALVNPGFISEIIIIIKFKLYETITIHRCNKTNCLYSLCTLN